MGGIRELPGHEKGEKVQAELLWGEEYLRD